MDKQFDDLTGKGDSIPLEAGESGNGIGCGSLTASARLRSRMWSDSGVIKQRHCGDSDGDELYLCPSCAMQMWRNRNWWRGEHSRIFRERNKLSTAKYMWKANAQDAARLAKAILINIDFPADSARTRDKLKLRLKELEQDRKELKQCLKAIEREVDYERTEK